jgi:hypothetical protein
MNVALDRMRGRPIPTGPTLAFRVTVQALAAIRSDRLGQGG